MEGLERSPGAMEGLTRRWKTLERRELLSLKGEKLGLVSNQNIVPLNPHPPPEQ
jgi:hypothetical protein